MARRNLLQEAQAQAVAEIAPQVFALEDALGKARADRNSAIRAAATAYTGLSGAIHRAGGEQRKVYLDAKKLAAGTDAIAKPAVQGNATIAAAYAHEGAVGGNVLARAMASRLSDLSDRRIAAEAGRVYSVNKANSDYSAAAATNATQRSRLGAQQGALTASNLSKLTESQANRDLQVNLLNRREAFDARESAAQRSFTSHENALGRRADRINTGISSRSDLAKIEQQQQFTAGENAKDRKLRLRLAKDSGGAGGGPKPTAETTFKGRQAIQAWVDKYGQDGDMSTTAGDARKKGIPSPIINAAADLYSKGHIAPRGVAALERMGIAVPKEWTGVQVRPHTRRRRSK